MTIAPDGGDAPLRTTLERLMALPAASLVDSLRGVADILAGVLAAEKVDAWVPRGEELVALGVSNTPLGRKEVALGLDRLPLDEPDRVQDVFHTGRPYWTGRADLDERVPRPVVEDLGVRSMACVPFTVAGERRGVLLVASTQADAYSEASLSFLTTTVLWIDLVAHRAELVEREIEAARAEQVVAEAVADLARLRALFEQAPAFIAVLRGPNHVFEVANPLYLQLVGHRAILDKPVRLALPEVKGQRFVELLDRVYTTGEPFVGTEVLVRIDRRGDGTLDDAFLNFVYQPLREHDRVAGIFVHGVEVTDQVRARQNVEMLAEKLARSEDRFRRALEIETVGVTFFDLDGAIHEANDAFLRMSGYTREDVANGRVHWDWMTPPEWAPATRRVADDLEATGVAAPYEKECQRKDGSRWWGLFAPRMLTATEGVEFILDITDRKVAEAEREQAIETARAAVKARDEFLGIASHELRNPLAGLKGTAQMLRRRHQRGRLTEDALARYLGSLEGSADRLARLVDDLLDVSRLRTGQLRIRPANVQLAALLREAVERQRQVTPRASIVLHADCTDCLVRGDPDRLTQVITNLLENAVKYSPEGGTIDVSLTLADGGVRVCVADPGIGLPPDSLEAIFQPFGRAPNAAERNIPGMGLGLYICRQIVGAHGGRLWAESEGENRGTTVCLWLPTHTPEESGA